MKLPAPKLVVIGGFGSTAASLPDPLGTSPVVAAMRWIEGTLLGTIALTVAIIAVAYIGFMMLSGRVNVRYGMTVIAGCFVLFSASSIVAGIQSGLNGSSAGLEFAAIPEAPAVTIPPQPSQGHDPYAGASLQRR